MPTHIGTGHSAHGPTGDHFPGGVVHFMLGCGLCRFHSLAIFCLNETMTTTKGDFYDH
jgi:hypothetical protein